MKRNSKLKKNLPWMWNYLCSLDYTKRWIYLLQCIFDRKYIHIVYFCTIYIMCFSWYFCANWVTNVKWIEKSINDKFSILMVINMLTFLQHYRNVLEILTLIAFMMVKTQTSIRANVSLTKGLKHYWIEWLAGKRERLPWMPW